VRAFASAKLFQTLCRMPAAYRACFRAELFARPRSSWHGAAAATAASNAMGRSRVSASAERPGDRLPLAGPVSGAKGALGGRVVARARRVGLGRTGRIRLTPRAAKGNAPGSGDWTGMGGSWDGWAVLRALGNYTLVALMCTVAATIIFINPNHSAFRLLPDSLQDTLLRNLADGTTRSHIAASIPVPWAVCSSLIPRRGSWLRRSTPSRLAAT
jgi:hypothetical protein